MRLSVGTQNGQEFSVIITKVMKDFIEADLNPPMAGKNLNFRIKIVDVS